MALGVLLQKRFVFCERLVVDEFIHGGASPNNTYYILKKTEVPTVIVECGFLSNYKEAQKLVTEDYQKSVAEAVAEGILSYIKENE